MRAAIRAEAGRYPAAALAAWGSLPALYHRWAMTAGGEARLVATRGGRAAGFAGWRGAELTALFVRPGARGAGIATRLVARVEAEVAGAGHRALAVLAAAGAAGFYRARGFEPVGPARAPLPGGGSLPALRLRKRLAPARRPRGPAGGPAGASATADPVR